LFDTFYLERKPCILNANMYVHSIIFFSQLQLGILEFYICNHEKMKRTIDAFRNLNFSEIHVHIDSENISRTVRLRCHVCGWDFYDKSTKNRHLKKIHGLSREDVQDIEVELFKMKRVWVPPKVSLAEVDDKLIVSTPEKQRSAKRHDGEIHGIRRPRRYSPSIDREIDHVVSRPCLLVQPVLHCLPSEILAQIFARLRARPLLRASATCHALADAVSSGELWRRLFLAHSDSPLAAATLSQLRIPSAVWCGLYRGMFIAHISARRGRRATAAAPRGARKGRAAAAPAPARPWRCPSGRCAAAFRSQEKLLAHVARHYPAAGCDGC
jgi:uncharacterized C2H2 Zn-finger protein